MVYECGETTPTRGARAVAADDGVVRKKKKKLHEVEEEEREEGEGLQKGVCDDFRETMLSSEEEREPLEKGEKIERG